MRGSLLGNLLRQGAATGTAVFLFVLAAVAGRYLGPEDFGIFSFALAFVFFFDIILDPGLYHLLIREIARDRDRAAEYVRHGVAWKFVASPLAFLLIAAGVHLLHDSSRIHEAVYVMTLAAVLKSTKDVYAAALLANERFGLNAISAFLERGGILLAGSAVLVAGHGLIPFCWTFVAVRAIDLAVIRLLTIRTCAKGPASVDWRSLGALVRAGAPIGALYVTLNIYNYVDTVMISVLRNQTETGWYGASFRLYEGLRMVPDVIGMVLLPSLSRAFAAAAAELARLVSTAYRYIFALALLVSGLGILLSGDIMRLAFGAEYQPATLALAILVAGAPFAFLVHFLQMALIAMDRQRLLLIVALVGLAANVALNLAVIPRYGFVGAAVTTIAVEALVCGALSISAHRFRALSPSIPRLSVSLACWLGAGALVLGPLSFLPAYLKAAVFLVAFPTLVWMGGGIDVRDRARLRFSRNDV